MATININNRTDTIKGTFTSQRTVLADGEVSKDPLLAAAKVGALTTRTSDSVGTLTMEAEHGIVDANRLDIYWTNPDGTVGIRYGCTVGVVAGNDIPITAGAGDVLPADETALTAMVPTLETFPVITADMQSLNVGCMNGPMIAVFRDSLAADVLAVVSRTIVDHYSWDVDGPLANPFAADVVEVYLSHGVSTGSARPIALATVS